MAGVVVAGGEGAAGGGASDVLSCGVVVIVDALAVGAVALTGDVAVTGMTAEDNGLIGLTGEVRLVGLVSDLTHASPVRLHPPQIASPYGFGQMLVRVYVF